jgi:hypothetical protein
MTLLIDPESGLLDVILMLFSLHGLMEVQAFVGPESKLIPGRFLAHRCHLSGKTARLQTGQ